MAPEVLTPAKPEEIAFDEGSGPRGGGAGGFGGNGGGESRAWSVPARAYRTGMYMALAGITMLFAAFTSAMVVRQGVSNDWVHTSLPRVLWLNTAILLASSATLELAKRGLKSGQSRRFILWLDVTAVLGAAFIAGQLVAWKELAARGVYLATNPSSSFFYLLTAAHGVHLLGGITALFYLVIRARPSADGSRPARQLTGAETPVEVTAIYWHFMDGLWVYILILMMTRL
jgi:cytochrome c oxidase subunit III